MVIFASCLNTIYEGNKVPEVEAPEESELTIGYLGEDLTGIVEIIRDISTKQVRFKITENCEWQLYAGPTLDMISFENLVAKGDASGTFVLDVPFGSHCYFQVVTPKGSAILSERRPPISGAANFRDMGGYKTADGRYVKWGTLYRSSTLEALTPADLAYVSTIPLVSVVDFRPASDGGVDKLPESTVYYNYPIIMGAEASYGSFYEAAVKAPNYIEQYRKMFALLQNEDNAPLLIHCIYGKDRTGVGAALILFALGVDTETIMTDYLLTNYYTVPTAVNRSWLEQTIYTINSVYGSIDLFLVSEMGIGDIEAFRDKYLLGEK